MAAKRRKLVAEDFDLGYGSTTIPTDSGGVRAASKVGIHILTGEISVKSLGATGDGVTDDTVAINNAYAQLTNNGTLIFPAGTYKITSQLDWSDAKNVVVKGSGHGASIILVSGAAAFGTTPFFGAIKLSTTSAGLKTVRDLTIKRASAGSISNDNGIVLGPVQNNVNIERVEILNMGNDAILHRGNSALVRIMGCYIHLNAGYGINGTGASAAIQNLVIAGNTIFNNGGGIAIASSNGLTIRDNDVEGGTGSNPANPLLNITGSVVTMSGNTVGLVSTATATQAVVLNAQNLTSIGDSVSVSGTNQVAVTIGASARNVAILGPQLSAPGGGALGTTAVSITAGATDSYIINPNFGNTFATKLTDNGTRTTFWTNTTDAVVQLFQNLKWGNGNGELATNGNILLNSATHGVANTAGDVFLRALANSVIRLQDTNGVDNLTVDTSTKKTDINRLTARKGTASVSGDYALSAGFGSTASVGSVSGTDQRVAFTVTSAGVGQALNPTITWTFKDGTWTNAPFAVVYRFDGNQMTVANKSTVSATQVVITFLGTPVAAETYSYIVMLIG